MLKESWILWLVFSDCCNNFTACLQRREFAWLLENEFVQKLEDIHKCLLVGGLAALSD